MGFWRARLPDAAGASTNEPQRARRECTPATDHQQRLLGGWTRDTLGTRSPYHGLAVWGISNRVQPVVTVGPLSQVTEGPAVLPDSIIAFALSSACNRLDSRHFSAYQNGRERLSEPGRAENGQKIRTKGGCGRRRRGNGFNQEIRETRSGSRGTRTHKRLFTATCFRDRFLIRPDGFLQAPGDGIEPSSPGSEPGVAANQLPRNEFVAITTEIRAPARFLRSFPPCRCPPSTRGEGIEPSSAVSKTAGLPLADPQM